MNAWSDGYATDVAYNANHFSEMAPAHLNLALLQLGLAAPAPQDGFTYLELGFGLGLGLNLLAATHPQGRFFGNDFMPEHVLAAQNLATQAGLKNLQLFEDSFEELLQRDLPQMDYIVLHGVYSWVNEAARAQVVALLRKLLKTGGVVYISYNALPGWAAKAPLQKLMREFADRQAGGSPLARLRTARDFVVQLDTSELGFFAQNPGAHTMLEALKRASDAYLLHEFGPRGWTPFYASDVAQDLAAAKLGFVGSAKLFNNFPAYSLSPNAAELLAATPDAGMRELLRDFATQTQFRRDIFVRGSRRLTSAESQRHYNALRLGLRRPLSGCALRCETPVGEVSLKAETYRPLLESLALGPQALETLAALPAFAGAGSSACIDALNLLACLGYVGAAQDDDAAEASRAASQALNQAVMARAVDGQLISALASPRLGSGIDLPSQDLLFLAARQAGASSAEELGEFAQIRLAPLTKQSAQDARVTLTRLAQDFLDNHEAFYRMLGLC